MKYEILGPLRVNNGSGAARISARKMEVLLTVLIVRANQVVTMDQLITESWGDSAPRRAIASLHVYVSQLRKLLASADRVESPIITSPPGYLLKTGDNEVDVDVFLQLISTGRRYVMDGSLAEASDHFERALSLWRGPVLGGIGNGPILDGYVTWLTETRLECLEMLYEAMLGTGRHREIIGALYTLTIEHPLREVFYRQLMLALYRAECRADALGVYQYVRKKLNEELGLEPCQSLQDLQRAILRDDHRLRWRRPAAA